MEGSVDFLDLLGLDKELLYTSDGRSVALIEEVATEKTVVARVSVVNGRLRLSVGPHLEEDATDFEVMAKH